MDLSATHAKLQRRSLQAARRYAVIRLAEVQSKRDELNEILRGEPSGLPSIFRDEDRRLGAVAREWGRALRWADQQLNHAHGFDAGGQA